MANETRQVVESVLGSQMTAQIWTSTYYPAFPFVPQDFSVGAVLPMMLYLFRWGNRRGKGQFAETYGNAGAPTIASTVNRLVSDPLIHGFDSPSGRAILGDFLLTSILENRRHSESQPLLRLLDRPSNQRGASARRSRDGDGASERSA
jgi:hypothetical protein